MEVEVARGIGYIPVEQQEREKEIGTIAIDAIYTPVKRVNFEVENMRVGKRTDYDKITIEIMTDGSIAPDGAFNKAVDILMSQFSALASKEVAAPEKIEKVTKKKAAKKSE
jgi:DNA-directed RNA polymerase subunit alpha